MFNSFFKKTVNNVTRFIKDKNFFDANNQTIDTRVYYTPSNLRDGEFSVYDIDQKLAQNKQEDIYKLGDKMRKKPIARVDLKTNDIFAIKSPKQLYLEAGKSD